MVHCQGDIIKLKTTKEIRHLHESLFLHSNSISLTSSWGSILKAVEIFHIVSKFGFLSKFSIIAR